MRCRRCWNVSGLSVITPALDEPQELRLGLCFCRAVRCCCSLTVTAQTSGCLSGLPIAWTAARMSSSVTAWAGCAIVWAPLFSWPLLRGPPGTHGSCRSCCEVGWKCCECDVAPGSSGSDWPLAACHPQRHDLRPPLFPMERGPVCPEHTPAPCSRGARPGRLSGVVLQSVLNTCATCSEPRWLAGVLFVCGFYYFCFSSKPPRCSFLSSSGLQCILGVSRLTAH